MKTQSGKLTYEFKDNNSDAKLRELILHIATQCSDAPKFGMTKLNKILYFSDFLWYKRTGKPITGTGYMHLDKGPAPKRMIPIRQQMHDNDEIDIEKRVFPNGHIQQRIVVKAEADLDQYFTPGQIAFVDEIIRILWDANAGETSDISHGIAWCVFNADKEPIPYEAALLSDEKVTSSDIERTGELAKQYGW